MSIPLVLPDYSPVVKYCGKRELANAERARLCNDLATALIDKDTTLLGYVVGVRLGERLGWSAERLAQLKEDQKVLMEPLSGANTPVNFFSCEGATQLFRHVREVVLVGEATYGRRLLAARRGQAAVR